MAIDRNLLLKKRDIERIEEAAAQYEKLVGKTVTFYHLEGNDAVKIPVVFEAGHFAHLAGLVPNRKAGVRAVDVYKAALEGQLERKHCMLGHSRKLFDKKMDVFADIADIAHTARSIGEFDAKKFVRAKSKKTTGKDSACLGLAIVNNHYVPNTVINHNISGIIKESTLADVLAVTIQQTGRRSTTELTYLVETMSKRAQHEMERVLGSVLRNKVTLERRELMGNPDEFYSKLYLAERLQSETLPLGWAWTFYPDEGSGCLGGPLGERFFEFDLMSRTIQDGYGNARISSEFNGDVIEKCEEWIEENYLPQVEIVERLKNLSIADCFSYAAQQRAFQNYIGYDYVAVSPENAISVRAFNDLSIE